MELEDNDDQPSVAVEVNDAVVGQQDAPPYQVGLEAAPLLENVETHDQEVTLLVRASDYLGNESTVAPEVRVTRADWAIAVNEHNASMTVKGNSAVAFGLWDSVDSQGRIIALGNAGSGGAIWDVKAPYVASGPATGRRLFLR